MITDRRGCLRHKVHGPIFASFDGVTGGMILDLSEQGLSMQTAVPLEADHQFQLSVDLPDSDTHLDTHLETTGYIAWADALGRAGVRFSELPVEARQRLDEWLVLNDTAPSRKAPKLSFDRVPGLGLGSKSSGNAAREPRSISLEASLEAEAGAAGIHGRPPVSTSIQYEFNSLGSDLNTGVAGDRRTRADALTRHWRGHRHRRRRSYDVPGQRRNRRTTPRNARRYQLGFFRGVHTYRKNPALRRRRDRFPHRSRDLSGTRYSLDRGRTHPLRA